jgi:hypothetical protein
MFWRYTTRRSDASHPHNRSMPPKTPYDHLEQQVPAMRLVAKVVGFFVPSVRESWKSAEAQLEKLQEMRLNIGLFAERYVCLLYTSDAADDM